MSDYRKYIETLDSIEYDEEYSFTKEEIDRFLEGKDQEDALLDIVIGANVANVVLSKYIDNIEELTAGKQELLNYPDIIEKAHHLQYPNMGSLKEHVELLSPDGIEGLKSGIKGKLFELNLQELLSEEYPNANVEVFGKANEPIRDLLVDFGNGDSFSVQAKMWADNNSSVRNALRLIEENEALGLDYDLKYAFSSEVTDKLIEVDPSLADDLIITDESIFDYDNFVGGEIEDIFAANDIEIPDLPEGLADLGDFFEDWLPFAGEIVLGMKALLTIKRVNNDFVGIPSDEKTRICAAKMLMLISKYGVRAACSIVGAAAGALAGSGIPVAGNLVGGAAGGVVGFLAASKINKNIKPYIKDLANKVVGIPPEQAFYYSNKEKIDRIALSFHNLSLDS